MEGVRGLYRVSVGGEGVRWREIVGDSTERVGCVFSNIMKRCPHLPILPSLSPSSPSSLLFIFSPPLPSPLLRSSQGVGPTAQRAAVIAGVLLPSYDFFKKLILDSGLLQDNIATHFL